MENHSRSLLSEVFEDSKLPALIYAAKQNYGKDKYLRPMHSHHSVCEIVLFFRGFATIHINEFTYPAQPGDVLYCNCGELHEIISDYEEEVGLYTLGFSNFRFRGLPKNFVIPADSPHVRPAQQTFPFLRDLAEQTLQQQNGNSLNQLTAQLMAASLLTSVAQLPALASNHSPAISEMANRIRDYIDTHFTEPLTLKSIADAMSCSTHYVAHTFKNAMGYSPIQYAIRCRIGLAQNLLISSDYSSTYIASLVGYSNPNYFNALFSQIVGIPPIQFRKKYLELHGNHQLL